MICGKRQVREKRILEDTIGKEKDDVENYMVLKIIIEIMKSCLKYEK